MSLGGHDSPGGSEWLSEGAASPRLCEILFERRDRILADWEAAVRASPSPSATLEHEALLNDIPKFLDRLIVWLDDGSADPSATVDRHSTGRHARHRLEFGVELRYLIDEYRMLRRIIIHHAIDGGLAGRGGLLDLARLDDALDDAMTETVATYARERDESRDMLLGIIGHDLRNPLAAVKVASAALSQAGSLEDARAVGKRIKHAADRIGRMLSDLLDLARARFGAAMPVNPEPADLGEIAQNTVDELRTAHPERRLEIVRSGDLRGCWDRARMGQLVSNLVANAIQHGLDPITVCVEADGDGVRLRVANHGDPIPPASVPTLFAPFRVQSAEKDTARVGLGLFIVAEIARRHGGSIDVQSSGDETAFTVSLPRKLRP